ncbi:hypothetical protein SAMN05421877_102255 [Sphingobacterium lactis]|uniref:Uncharacterized protein n=1 Tax=Sphingobacterium lactis TaxID=797291 RepID=A0A1H5UDB0_9SPHI|nr:hypothetical protein SAMN05421877_102255 [Sphingobacterium lactis]
MVSELLVGPKVSNKWIVWKKLLDYFVFRQSDPSELLIIKFGNIHNEPIV